VIDQNQITSTRVRLESLNNSVDYSGHSNNATNATTLQNVMNQKTNSRGYNRSQVPNQANNIGIIQNFNSYHIELKNVTKDGAPEETNNSLERLV
jgi:hypothetical protein